MAHDLKPFQFRLLLFADPGFLLCDRDLPFNRIHVFKIGVQKPPFVSPGYTFNTFINASCNTLVLPFQ